MIIYFVMNKINGNMYVGQTVKTLKKRWWEHLYDAKTKCLYPLHKAIRKYGENNFEIGILFTCETQEEMDFTEIFCISFLNTKTPLGYNILYGGGIQGAHRGHRHSEETKKKFSNARKGRVPWNKGKKASPETVEKNRKSHLGKSWSPNRIPNNGWLGKSPTKEHREKISQAKKDKGKPWSQLRWEKFNARRTQNA